MFGVRHRGPAKIIDLAYFEDAGPGAPPAHRLVPAIGFRRQERPVVELLSGRTQVFGEIRGNGIEIARRKQRVDLIGTALVIADDSLGAPV